MTDQTESDDYPICEDECVTWGGHAENCRVPAAIRALEAKVREGNDALFQAGQAYGELGRGSAEHVARLRAERDRLAGEVERLKATCLALHAKRSQDVDERNAEVARLTSELAALRQASLEAISAFRTLGKAHVSLYTLREMGRLAKAAHIAWCPWHSVDWTPSSIGCPKCQDEVDAARRAGGEG